MDPLSSLGKVHQVATVDTEKSSLKLGSAVPPDG